MKGRKPKPTHLKLVAGNPGRRRLNATEPKPRKLIALTAPEHLSAAARGEWVRVSNDLRQMGLLTAIDRAALAGYCQAYADWVEAEEQLRRYGKVLKSPIKTIVRRARDGSEVTETTGGYPLQSPFWAIRNKALELMHKFLVEFGMTPSARSRVTASAEETKDASDEFFTA